MENTQLISAKEFCIHHNVELSFIHSLRDSGLLNITVVEETVYVPSEELCELEKMARFHYDFGINVAGIETIQHLLHQMDEMKRDIIELHNRLQAYE